MRLDGQAKAVEAVPAAAQGANPTCGTPPVQPPHSYADAYLDALEEADALAARLDAAEQRIADLEDALTAARADIPLLLRTGVWGSRILWMSSLEDLWSAYGFSSVPGLKRPWAKLIPTLEAPSAPPVIPAYVREERDETHVWG